MSKTHQRLELIANVLIIVVAVSIVGFLAQRYFFPNTPTSIQPKSPVIGNKVSIANFDLSASKKNVLLVLQKGCHFCSESAEFYKKVIQQVQGKNIRVIAVLPQKKEDAEKYLSDLGIFGIEIKQSQLNALDVGGTPTIIITNDKGEILNRWLGKLPSEKEMEVLNQLLN